ncbi:MAG: thioredoxin-disulfide reductase [Syntrophales bacterium]
MQLDGNKVYDTVIIGAGPAGFTAGLYAARAGLKTLLLEGATTVSQITMTDLVENYPGIPEGINGFELVQLFRKQAESFGMEVVSGDVTSLITEQHHGQNVWKVKAGKEFRALSIIVATGANWRKIGVPGEDAFIGRGVSYCATCDGPFYRNKEVVVVGGGDTAVQEAIFLTRFASQVTVIHRRDRLRATKILQERAFANSKIRFVWNAVPEAITGQDFVQGIKIRDIKTGTSTDIPAEGAFIFIGLTPNTEIFRELVRLDKHGYIITDGKMQTSTAGIFAAGDCTEKLLRQVVTACGDGATAAFAAQLYVEELKGEPLLTACQ